MRSIERIAVVIGTVLFALFGTGAPTYAQSGLSPSAIFRSARPSIVFIVGGDRSGQPTVQGSGFIIAPDRIITNHHVVAGASTALAVFSDGATSAITEVAADSPTQDLIVLVAKTGQRPSLHLGDELTLQQGDPVYAIGAPQGLELTLTNGIVSAFRNIDNRFLIQSTAAIGHGSSGGPLFDREGKVVGVTSALLSGTPGIYFAVGAGDLKRLLRTPQLVVLSFTEWARQNTDETTGSSASQAASPSASDADQIEKLLQDKKFDQARTAVQTLSAQEPDAEIVHRLTGELDERTGDLDGALRELDLAIQKEPTDAVGQFYYAIALFGARRFQEALDHEQKSNALEPTDSDQPLLALLYYSVRNYAQAEDVARKILTSDSKNETALAVLAGVAYHGASSQQDTWEQYAQQLSVVNPDSFWVHMSQGFNAYSQKQVENAVAAFTAAEQDNFPDSAPYFILATWYDGASDIGRANDQIEAGLASIPDDLQLLSEGVYVSLRGHDNTEAGRRFSSLEESYKGTLETVGTGCLYYYGVGQPLDALPYCARQAEMSPNDHTAHSNYGWAALDANKFPLALQQFSQAYKIASPNWNQLSEVQVVDLLWGFTIADYYTGDKKHAHKLLRITRKNYPTAATVTGLQQMPFLWSAATMTRIETILREFPN
ncbi:MAG: trypsin-like peptidase domain-containing protein [Candidatus Acidiferrales bacterium]